MVYSSSYFRRFLGMCGGGTEPSPSHLISKYSITKLHASQQTFNLKTFKITSFKWALDDFVSDFVSILMHLPHVNMPLCAQGYVHPRYIMLVFL